MFKVRLSFSKQGYAKYVSNLDLMRMFQRVFKIAKVDIAYSQGFNPHQKISISHPLPIGVTGSEEYIDIQTNTMPDYDKIVCDINEILPPDIRILWAGAPKDNLNEIKMAEYDVEFTVLHKLPDFKEYVDALKVKDDIVVSKKTKRGISNVDIKPYTHKLEILESDGYEFKLKMILETSDVCNLKATTVLDAFKKYIPNFELDYYVINRNALYKKNMTKINR